MPQKKPIESLSKEEELLLALKKRVEEIKRKLQREAKRLLKNQKKMEQELQESLLFQEKQHEGELLKGHFQELKKGIDHIFLFDWQKERKVKIELNPLLEPKAQVAARFKKAKKLKAAIPHQELQIVKLGARLEAVSKELEQLVLFKTMKELEAAYPVKIKEKKEKSLPYREFVSDTGFKILVGKNSKCNDALTFQYAKGTDLWLHVKDYPGSHVVIVRPKGKEVDQGTIEKAVSLACYYSKAKDAAHAEVCLTERKYVSRFGKKRDGKVQISKQKILHK